MAYFVIAGKPDCPAFVHGVHIARYLEKTLPNFHLLVKQKRTEEWKSWLEDVNYKNNWNHYSSPLIWKELSIRGGTAHYLGGLSEFWEYCFDYYGLVSAISSEDLKNMVEDNMQYFQELEKRNMQENSEIRHIGIFGMNTNSTIRLLLSEILETHELQKSKGICIKFYDFHGEINQIKEAFHGIIEDLKLVSIKGDTEVFSIVEQMRDLLVDCELLIILGDYSRREHETETDWLIRNVSVMFMLADEINVFAKRSLRVVLALDGPVCFNASILMDSCTSIRIKNIVAITSDAGLGPLKWAAEQTSVPLQELGAPPVWGFVGINSFVDLRGVILRADIYRPYQRVIKNNGGSTLPLGTIETELRFAAYLIEEPKEALETSERKRLEIKQNLYRQPSYAKIRALISLLKLWFAKKSSDCVISLGICSNGSFGIPAGLSFSQPAILAANMWIPFKNFPITKTTEKEIFPLLNQVATMGETLCFGPYQTGCTDGTRYV